MFFRAAQVIEVEMTQIRNENICIALLTYPGSVLNIIEDSTTITKEG